MVALIADDPERDIKTENDTGVLAFSIIMLNTDQHNPQVRKRMTFHDYSRNVRGLNSGEDFNPEYLKSIYIAIQQNEIVLAEERGGDLGFNYEWKELLKRMETLPQITNRDSNAFDKDMFLLVSVPLLASIFYSKISLIDLDFENCQDIVTCEKSMAGIQQAATLSVKYQLHDIFDFIITSLLRISGLSKPSKTLPIEIDLTKPLQSDGTESEKERKKTDRWAVDFGQSYRGAVAAVMAFNFVKDFPDSLMSGWSAVILATSNLYLHQLLPLNLMLTEHFCKAKITIPRLLVAKTEKDVDASSPRRETGLFSSFAQFLSLSSNDYDDEYADPSLTLGQVMAVEGVSYCCIEEILEETRFVEDSTVLRLIDCLVASSCSESRESDKNGNELAEGSIIKEFSQSSVFLLELLFRIVQRNRDRLNILWPHVAKHLEATILPGTPIPLLEGASTNILRLLLRLTHVVCLFFLLILG